MHIKTIRKEDKNKTNFQNPFEGDDNIENNFLKNYGRKIYVIKGFYRNFLTLKEKFHHQSQITLNFGQPI